MKEKVQMNNILEQGVLFGRLCELLKMPQTPTQSDLEAFGWERENWKNGTYSFCKLIGHRTYEELGDSPTFIEIFQHPLTQQVWKDELIKVCKEMLGDQCFDAADPYAEEVAKTPLSFLVANLAQSLTPLEVVTKGVKFTPSLLEAILNKYGRSLKND